MKKLLLLTALLTLFMSVSAQEVSFSVNEGNIRPPNQIFEGYFVLGCTLPTFNGDTKQFADDFSYVMYLSTGIDFGFKPSPRILPVNVGTGIGLNLTSWASIMAGIELIPKGIIYRGTYTDEYDYDYKIRATYKINYVEFPLCIRLSTRSWTRPDKTFFYVKGGVAPAINVVSKLHVYVFVSGGGSSDSDTETEDLDGVNKNDFCEFVAIGIGKHKGSFFEIKYETGTKSVFDPEASAYSFYNRSVSLNLVATF